MFNLRVCSILTCRVRCKHDCMIFAVMCHWSSKIIYIILCHSCFLVQFSAEVYDTVEHFCDLCTSQSISVPLSQWCCQLWGTGARALPPPWTSTISFLVHFRVALKLTAIYCIVCEISWCKCQQITFDQYHISHKTISHQAAAAANRECPVT